MSGETIAGWASPSLAADRAPAVIAHRGGNSFRQVEAAIDAGADLVEVDLWSFRKRLEARHERRVPPTRILFERWYLRWAEKPHFTLPDLLQLTAGRIGVLLDFKNRTYAPELVREALDSVGGRVNVCASSQFWPILRLVHRLHPEMEMFYSIDVRSQLDLFFSVIERDFRPAGVSCNHRHLDRDSIERFHDLGLAVIAWTVDDPWRAAELADLGVDAITTNCVPEIRACLDRR